jgi:hypothetical protein
MRMAPPRIRIPAYVLGILMLAPLLTGAQETETPSLIEVNWHASRVIDLPGVTSAVSLDHQICQARIETDAIQLTGVERGETVLLAWAGETRRTYRIRVVAPPPQVIPRLTSNRERLDLGRGSFSNSFVRIANGGTSSSSLLNQFDWAQIANGRGMAFRAQSQDQLAGAGRDFAVNGAALQFFTPNSSLSLGDFLLSSPIESESRMVPVSTYNNVVLRGADAWMRRGRNRLELFGGTTIPPYYLSLGATRSIVGLSLTHRFSDDLYLSGTSGAVSAISAFAPSDRQTLPFQTVSVALGHRAWKAEATGGISTSGAMVQASASYQAKSGIAYAAITRSSAEFPLNQLQLFYAGGSSLSAGATYHLNTRMDLTGYVQHSSNPAIGARSGSSGNYVNPNLTFRLTARHQFVVNYAYTSLDQEPLNHNTAQRIDVFANSNFGHGLANTAQVSVGIFDDLGAVRSQNDFSVRDVMTIPVRFGILSFGVQHVRTDPSLAAKLASNLALLTPAERQAMLIDPVGFASNFPISPATRLLLSQVQPSTTEVTAGAQISVWRKMSISPTLHLSREQSSIAGQSFFHASMSYSAVFTATRSFSLQSSLSQVLDLSSSGTLRRSNAITFGIRKSFQGRPDWFLSGRRAPGISGRICVDMNVDGRCSDIEPGAKGIRVMLDGGASTVTDERGRFRFANVRAGTHRVSLPIDHLASAFRFTAASDVPVDVEEGDVSLEFSVVNFARVMGNVFNDYRMNRDRQPDAPGLARVPITLSSASGFTRTINSDGSGDFEMMEVPPGDYLLSVETGSVPPDYRVPQTEVPLHVEPVTTVVHDIPVQALRSMAGHIFEAVPALPGTERGNKPQPAPTPQLKPIAGVRVRVGKIVVTTDEAGEFMARDLPAGEILVQVLPASGEVPAGIRLPSGRVNLSKAPTQLKNVRIVVSDPAVLRLLRSAQ